MSSHHRAFTLIEMLGVIAIMAVLSGTAAMMLGGSRHTANLQRAMEQLEQADVSARTLARSSDHPVALSLELASGQLRRSSGDITTVLGNLTGDVRIERERVGNISTDFGSANIEFDARGCSVSYAIRLADAGGEKQWIVFAGLSGQMLKASDEDIDAIFTETADQTKGPGADTR